MNTFKKDKLHEAVLSTLSPSPKTGEAVAVFISPDRPNAPFLYPYHTVVSTERTRSVKVKFYEGKNSREVLDFNLFLSPADVWRAPINIEKESVNLDRTREGYFEIFERGPVICPLEPYNQSSEFAINEAVRLTDSTFSTPMLIPSIRQSGDLPETHLSDWQLILNNRTLFLPFKNEKEDE